MRKNYLMLWLLLAITVTGVRAQRDAVAAGGVATGSGGSVSYSVGQVDYTVSSGSGGSANQGVQQPYEIFIGIDDAEGIELSMSAYPNPVEGALVLQVTDLKIENLTARLSDMNGKQLLFKKLSAEKTLLDMERFARGTYVLSVSDGKRIVKSFTIIKNK